MAVSWLPERPSPRASPRSIVELCLGVVWLDVDQDMLLDGRLGENIIDDDEDEEPMGACDPDDSPPPNKSPKPGEAMRLRSDEVIFSGRSSVKSKSMYGTGDGSASSHRVRLPPHPLLSLRQSPLPGSRCTHLRMDRAWQAAQRLPPRRTTRASRTMPWLAWLIAVRIGLESVRGPQGSQALNRRPFKKSKCSKEEGDDASGARADEPTSWISRKRSSESGAPFSEGVT